MTEARHRSSFKDQQQGAEVDCGFTFLNTAQAQLLRDILARCNSGLAERLRRATSVSRLDAEEIMTVISDEIVNNLDIDWEPTEHGHIVSAVLAQFNKARLTEWP